MLHAHEPCLGQANAMLAGQGSAQLDNPLEQLGRGLFDPLDLIRIGTIEADGRVEVPVTGVTDGRDLEVVLLGNAGDRLEHVGHLGHGHGQVLYGEVVVDPGHDRICRFAGRPQRLRLFLRVCLPDSGGLVLFEDVDDFSQLELGLLPGVSIGLCHQNGLYLREV